MTEDHYSLHKRPGPGMTFGNMRENRVRNLSVQCCECHHERLLNADHFPDDVEIHSIESRLLCAYCGSIGKSDVMPNWPERPPLASLTGQQI